MRELASSGSPVAVVAARELTALIAQCYKREPQQKRVTPAKDFPHILYPGEKTDSIHLYIFPCIV